MNAHVDVKELMMLMMIWFWLVLMKRMMTMMVKLFEKDTGKEASRH